MDNFSIRYESDIVNEENYNYYQFGNIFYNTQKLDNNEYNESMLMYNEDIKLLIKEEEEHCEHHERLDMEYEDKRYHKFSELITISSQNIFKNYLKGDFKLLLCKQFYEYHIKVSGSYYTIVCSSCGENPYCIGSDMCRGGLSHEDYDEILNICTFNIKKANQMSFVISKLMYKFVLNKINTENFKNNINYIVEHDNYHIQLELFTKKVCSSYFLITKQIIKKLDKLNYDIIIYLLDFIS